MPRRKQPRSQPLPPPQEGEDEVIYHPDLERQVAALRLLYDAALRLEAEEAKQRSA